MATHTRFTAHFEILRYRKNDTYKDDKISNKIKDFKKKKKKLKINNLQNLN